MKIDFGVVRNYITDRGFGFVTRTFLVGRQSEVFFHIRNVKKGRPDLAEKLGDEESEETISFWYEVEETSKGEQVRSVLRSETIREIGVENLPFIIGKIEEFWRNINSQIPAGVRDATTDFVGSERAGELESERNELINEKKRIVSKRREEREAQPKQEEIEENEFSQLVAEMAPLGLTHSTQVSSYIVKNKLGLKYKNISGIVKMKQEGTEWNFKGGFPPNIYARLCEALDLQNNGTSARVVGFTSFKDLQNRP